MTIREQIEYQEHRRLNPLAAFSDKSTGRPVPYQPDENDVRTCYQRDSDRIVHCKAFRRRQTTLLKELSDNADSTYNAEGISTKVVIAHSPFSEKFEPPFDIEGDVYAEWCSLLKEHVKPHVMITGHKHVLEVLRPGCEKDFYGQPCTVVVGAKPGTNYFAGCGYVFGENEIVNETAGPKCNAAATHKYADIKKVYENKNEILKTNTQRVALPCDADKLCAYDGVCR